MSHSLDEFKDLIGTRIGFSFGLRMCTPQVEGPVYLKI